MSLRALTVAVWTAIAAIVIVGNGCAGGWIDNKFQDWWGTANGETNAPPEVVIPPVVVPPLLDEVAVPERTGNPAYIGTGDIAKWLEYDCKNPSKAVSLSCWVKIKSWPRPDVGAHLINKGLVGNSWAFGLSVLPGELQYSATPGAVGAAYKFKTGQWYYVRIDATKSEAKFWVDGKAITVTRKETSKLFASNDEPLRIGGHTMDWKPPSAWFNGSLDGEMSDYQIEVE